MSSPSWDDLRILLAVHRSKSFLAAGKVLGVATSTVARRVASLERTLGRPLVHRSNEGTELDPDLLRLVELGESVELGLDALRRDARDQNVAGTVRVSVSEGFVRPATRILALTHAKHPALSVELVCESRIADLARHEADIGIRITRSSSQALIEKCIGQARLALFAARSYADRRLPHAPISRRIAGQHDWVGFDQALERMPHERWMRDFGAKRFVFRSNSYSAIEEAIAAGMGIGLLSEAQGATLEGLVQLDAEEPPPSIDVFLVFHRDAKKTPRIRVVARELETEIRRALG
jgi:DNA-binding transcriptional LysR family regulator